MGKSWQTDYLKKMSIAMDEVIRVTSTLTSEEKSQFWQDIWYLHNRDPYNHVAVIWQVCYKWRDNPLFDKEFMDTFRKETECVIN